MIRLADAASSAVQIPSKYHYGSPVRLIYKCYPVYFPDREPTRYDTWRG
jgi:hypothetical protein